MNDVNIIIAIIASFIGNMIITFIAIAKLVVTIESRLTRIETILKLNSKKLGGNNNE
jgi:hypothetical protein